MKIFAAVLLTLSFAALAAAQTYTVYSVASVQQTAPNVYTATASTVKNPTSKAPIPADGTALTLTTTNCAHVPAKGGENGIVTNGPLGRTLLFTTGASCAVTSVK